MTIPRRAVLESSRTCVLSVASFENNGGDSSSAIDVARSSEGCRRSDRQNQDLNDTEKPTSSGHGKAAA